MIEIKANDRSAITTGKESPITQDSSININIKSIKRHSFFRGFITGILASIIGSAIWFLFLKNIFQ
jgi:hypothetical protein